MRELDAGQSASFVDLLGDLGQCWHVLVVPQPQLDERADVGRRVNLDLFGADHRPAALGLDLPHEGLARRIAVAHAVAVRNLEEPIARGHRPDLDWFEQNVVARISHGSLLLAPQRGGR